MAVVLTVPACPSAVTVANGRGSCGADKHHAIASSDAQVRRCADIHILRRSRQ